MIQTYGKVFLLTLTLFSFSANAGLFGTIESVEPLKEIAANLAKKKDNRVIASDSKKSEKSSTDQTSSDSQNSDSQSNEKP